MDGFERHIDAEGGRIGGIGPIAFIMKMNHFFDFMSGSLITEVFA